MRIHTDRPGRLELAALALILLLAAALRLGAPGISEFKLDEAHLSQLALDMARGHSFPLLGIGSSVGIPNLPVSVWLFALPYLFTSDPTAATLYVGLLNVLAVLLTWGLARRYFGPGPALVAALLYAASPWGVIYSRKIWAQDLLPPFVVLTAASGMLGFLEEARPGRWRWQVAHFGLLIITVQIHYAALTLIPLTLGFLWLGRKMLPRRTRRILIGLGLLGVVVIVGAAVLMQTRGIDLGVFGRNGLGLTGEAFYHFSLTITGNEIHSLAGPQAFQAYLATTPDLSLLQTLFGWLVILATGLAAYHAVRTPGLGRRVRLAFLAWLALPVAIFSITWTPTFPHYLIPLMPAAYILFGAGVGDVYDWLGQQRPQSAHLIAAVIGVPLVIFAGLQAWNVTALYAFVDTHATPSGFGTPLHMLLDVRQAILEQSPEDVLVVGLSANPHTDQEAAIWEFLLADVPSVRPLDARAQAVIGANPGRIVLNTPAVIANQEALLPYNRCAPAAPQFDLRPGEGSYILCAGEEPPLPFALSDGETASYATFANGVRLIGVAVDATSGDSPAILLGFGADVPLPGDVQVFNHLLDAAGERIGQQDGALWPRRYWRGGEIILQRFVLPMETDLSSAVTLRVGLYQFVDGQPVNLDILDVAGNPAGQWVDIPFAQIRP